MGPRVLPDFVHYVAVGVLETLNQRLGDVGEHQVITGVVEQQSDEPSSDVSRSEVHSFHQ
jgi:hypothetical protein